MSHRLPYTCPRCGYKTTLKGNMHKHLYGLKKPCPGQVDNGIVVLTDEIKAHILENRVYRPPVTAAQPPVVNNIQNIVGQYNVVNNFLSNLDTVDKVNMYMQHTHGRIAPFDAFVGRKYARKVELLESGNDESFYRPNDFLQLVDEVSNASTIEQFNLMYDNASNKVRIYEHGGWQEFITSSGLLRIVETLKDNLLDAYEIHLVQKMRKSETEPREQVECREHIEELYKFLAVFRLEPRVSDMTNDEIMAGSGEARYEGDESTTIEETCCKLYKSIRDKQPSAYVNRLVREIREIVKKNSAVAVRDVNRTVIELFNSDREFRDVVVNALPRVAAAL
jgi:hypothetical protein